MAHAARLADKYLETAAQQLTQLCSSGSSSSDSDPTLFKTRCRGMLASMAAVIIGLMSRLRDFEGFTSTTAVGDGKEQSAEDLLQNLQVVGNCIPPIGSPGVRNRAAAALIVAIKHLRGGDRELLEQASYTSLLLMCPGMLEQALGGQGRQGGKDDGAIIDEPAAATAYILAAQGAAQVNSTTGSGSSGDKFTKAFDDDEQRVHAETAEVLEAAGADSSSQQPPGAGSWGSDWRWRRRTSPIAVMDRIRRMLLWRCAQAASRSGPPVAAASPVAAAAAQVRLEQLPQEYLDLFRELLVLSMQPNAGVRGSAMPTLHSCIKRFPCLVELAVPEVLAALASVPGPWLGPGDQQGTDSSSSASATTATDKRLPQPEVLEQFYSTTLLEAMSNQQADTGAAAAGSEQHTGATAAAMAALTAAAKAASAAGATDDSNGEAKAAAATAAASLAAANAAATSSAAASGSGGGRSVAEESQNDGRVAGACAVLSGCLDAWRLIFRDPLLFRGFMYALMASRCHSSNTCLKSIQMLVMQVGRSIPKGGVGSPSHGGMCSTCIGTPSRL